MAWYTIKIVPDKEPNHDGRWTERWYDEKPDFNSPIERYPDWHIVKYEESRIGPPDQPFYMHSSLRG